MGHKAREREERGREEGKEGEEKKRLDRMENEIRKSLKVPNMMQCNKGSILIKTLRNQTHNVHKPHSTFNPGSGLMPGALQWLRDKDASEF